MRQTKQLHKTWNRHIAQGDAALAHKVSRRETIPGGGTVLTVTALAEWPELGQLTPPTAVAQQTDIFQGILQGKIWLGFGKRWLVGCGSLAHTLAWTSAINV